MNREWLEAHIIELEDRILCATRLLESIAARPESASRDADYERNYDRRADYYNAISIAKGMLKKCA